MKTIDEHLDSGITIPVDYVSNYVDRTIERFRLLTRNGLEAQDSPLEAALETSRKKWIDYKPLEFWG